MWIKTHRYLVCMKEFSGLQTSTSLSPPVKYCTGRSKAILLFNIFYVFFSVLCLLCLCARLFICALWSPAGKGLTSWLSFVVSNCEFVTFPLVSWVRCGTLLYRFLILAPLLTLGGQRGGAVSKIIYFGIRSCCISNISERCMQQNGSKYFPHRHYLDAGGRVKRSIFFSESSHVAYQTKGNRAQSNMKANMLSLQTLSTPWVSIKDNYFF